MDSLYNSKLISRLRLEKQERNILEILEIMEEIKDPIFAYQIFEAWKENKELTISHYYLGLLSKYSHDIVGDLFLELVSVAMVNTDFTYVLDYFSKNEIYNVNLAERAKKILVEEMEGDDIDYLFINPISRYLKLDSKNHDFLEEKLLEIIETDRFKLAAKTSSMSIILRLNSAKWINYFYENYEKYKNTEVEIVFVKDISGWSKGIIDEVHAYILDNASTYPKSILKKIIRKKNEGKEKTEELAQEEIKKTYNTVDVVSEIYELRKSIDEIAIIKSLVKGNIFKADESLFSQLQPAESLDVLKSRCIDLREFISSFSKEINDFVLEDDEIIKILELKSIEEFNRGSLNNFYLFFKHHNIKINFELMKLKTLFSKIAHPGSKLNIALKDLKLDALYKEENWPKLNREILLVYKNFLSELKDELIK